MRRLFNPRFNVFDVVYISVASRLFMDGHWLAALLICVAGAVISESGENWRARSA